MLSTRTTTRFAPIALAALVGLGFSTSMAVDATAQRYEERRGGPPSRDSRVQPRRNAVWINLGCQAANFRNDRDVIGVGKQAGAFKAVRLRVSGNDIFINQLRVVYGNGQPDNLPVQRMIQAGTVTAPIDLIGSKRLISRIEMSYRSRPKFSGRATVCVEGLG